MAKQATVKNAIICIQMKKLALLDKKLENLRHGKTLEKAPTCFFMRAFTAVLWMATLIIATTMTMMWKAKEAVLGGVFSLEPAPLPDEETELDARPDEDETRIVPVTDSVDSDEDEDTTAKPVDPSLN